MPKSTGMNAGAVAEKYAVIKGNEDHFPAGVMCRMLSVSRSGHYDWKNSPLSERDQANQKGAEIKRVFDDEKGRPCSPRISRRLQAEGKPPTGTV